MQSANKPRWQQMTALVSLGTGGAMTGFSLIPGSTAANLASPAKAHSSAFPSDLNMKIRILFTFLVTSRVEQ